MRLFSYLLYTFLFLFVLTVSEAIAADDTYKEEYLFIDSLKNILETQSLPDNRKMEIYRDITYIFGKFAQDSVFVYAPKAIELARKQKDYVSITGLYNCIGVTYCFKSNYDSAFIYFDRVKELAREQGNKSFERDVLTFIAFAYAKQGKYNTAVDYYLKSLKISIPDEEINVNAYAKVLANLSEINRRLGNTETAIQYLKQAEENCNQMMKYSKEAYLWRMPQIYNEYAYNYMDQGNWEEALRYALKAESINDYKGVVHMCYTKGLLATIYLQRNDFDRALRYAKESYEQADILKDKNLYANAGKILSDVYLAQKRYLEAETEALKVRQTDSTDIDESRPIAYNIALANIYMNNKEKAAYYLKKYSELNDQYSKKSFQTTMSDLAVKYEIDKKEMRIASLEKERRLYLWLDAAGGLLLISMGLVLLQTIRNSRKERQLVAAKAVQDGEMRERARIAEDLHDRLGGSLSAVKIGLKNAENPQNVSDKLDECIKEVREITHNLMPRSLRLSGMKTALEDFTTQFPNVHFHFFGEEKRIKDRLEFIVYCCANELVTNSLRHSNAKNINVQLIQSEKHVSLTVQDDGCGFGEKDIIPGIGLKNIRDRVASRNGKLDIVSSVGKGTETIIELKVEN